jgi:hypothetical protein
MTIHRLPLLILVIAPSLEASAPFVESSVQPELPYVQQQVIYSLRLFRESHLQRGWFLPPEIEDALLIPLQSIPERRVTRDGREYELLEQRYLLFPQRSGRLHLPAPVFSSRELFIQGSPRALEVKPPYPDARVQPWLITPGVTIDEQWITPQPPWRVGDHLQRILRIEGRQLTGAQLPRVEIDSTERLQVLIGSEHSKDRLHAAGVDGLREVRLLYIPKEAGVHRIPSFEIAWWNSIAERREVTRVPGREFQTIPAASPAQRDEAGRTVATGGDHSATRSDPDPVSPWWWILVPVAAVILGTWLVRRMMRPLTLALQAIELIAACRRNNPRLVRELLEKGAAADGVFDLPGLAQTTTSPEARAALLELDRALYSGRGKPWRGKAAAIPLLRLLFKPGKRKVKTPKNSLPELWEETNSSNG